MPKIDIVNAKNIIESNPEKAFFKLKNTGGPKGDTGAQGPQGPKGDQGEPGAPGASASVTVGSTTTLSPGADATVTNSGDTRNAILNFGIPTGAQGPQGIQGPKGDTGPMGQTGAKGDTGAAATVQVGNTNTGAPGTNAQVTNAGNEHFAVFNFTIPRGDKGETGSTGPQGPKGDTGEQGPQGIQGPKGDTGSVKSDVVAELPETGEEDTFYLVNREATEQTATGKAINFTNSDNAGDITDFKLDGETSQNGTPTPDAPVAVNTTTGENVVQICGKNLLDIGSYLNESSDGLTFSYSNGKLTATGTPSPNEYANVTKKIATCLPAGTYTLSITQAVSHRVYLWLQYKDGTTASTFIINAGNTSATVSTAKEIAQIRLDFAGMTVGTAINETFGIQLEKSNSASTFEPYSGQSYEINLGKNLLDMATLVPGYVNGADGSITSSQTMGEMCSGFIEVEPSSTYTVSIAETTSTYTPWFGIGEYTAADKSAFIRRQANTSTPTSYTITTHSTAQYVRVSGRNFADATKIQFEKWPSPTDYAAYFEPIELCKIGDYQDSIYKSGSKWYVRKACAKYRLDSTKTWGVVGTTNYQCTLSNNNRIYLASSAKGYSNYFRVGSSGTDIYMYPILQGNTDYIRISNATSKWAASSDLTTFLANNEVYLYYPLADSAQTDTEITNQALIAQLDNVASAPLYTSVNNITTITPNEQGTLEIKYVTYDKYNQNKVYIWNDTLQQWQIIVQ